MEKKMISLEIPNDLRELLRKMAFEQKISISKLIRNILENAVKETR